MNNLSVDREHFEELPSTNDYAKSKRGRGKDLLVTATRQSGGRGTKGRTFSSEEGGLYLSLLRFYEDFPAREAFKLTTGASTAVCEALASFGVEPKIKWPNDIHVNGKKICGILIENTFSGARIASSVVGIGVNVNNDLPAELADIATTLQKETGVKAAVSEVEKRLIEALYAPHTMESYRAYLGYMGERAELVLENERIPVTLLSVTDDGKLRVLTDGGERIFSAAEVSVRV